MSVVVVVVGATITTAVTVAMVPVLDGLVEHQRARQAADAAALAGVRGGRSASVALAAANDGELIAWSRSGHRVTVEVRVGDRVAVARATDEP
jgi:predicted MarR family transcription regulator